LLSGKGLGKGAGDGGHPEHPEKSIAEQQGRKGQHNRTSSISREAVYASAGLSVASPKKEKDCREWTR